MTSVVLTPTTWQGIQSTSTASYAEMRNGHGLTVNGTHQIGISRNAPATLWVGNEDFLAFDLSGIPSAATITGVLVEGSYSALPASSHTDTYDLVAWDWGASVDTGDWHSNFPVSLAASLPNATIAATGTWYPFTNSGTVLLAAAQAAKGGTFKLALISQYLAAGTDLGFIDEVATASGYRLTVTYTLPAPTVSAISPNQSLLAGGGTATITGANFAQPGAGTTTATIGGVSATSVHVVNDTTITCVIPTSATAGLKTVAVTNGNGTGTASIFRYVDVKDYSVKFVKGGVVSGNEMADTATPWPLSDGVASYGASNDLQGLTLTDTDVNGSGFGLAIAASVPANNQAAIEYATITVYYTTPAGSGQSSYLIGLHVDTDRETTQPEIYKLPRFGFTVGQDASVNKATSDASFFTSRLFAPSRNVAKTYRALELWAELSPATNTPGLEAWAIVDDGAPVQLRDETGAAANITASGFHRLYFPADSRAVGTYVQLEFRVPALSGTQVPVAVAIRDVSLRASLRPARAEVVSAKLVLGAGEDIDRMTMQNTVKRQRALLEALLGPDAKPEPIRDPITGQSGYMELVGLGFTESMNPGASEPQVVADIQLLRTYYDG